MNIWGSKSLRRLALPLAVVGLGAAVSVGWGSSLASSTAGATPTVDTSVPDPEVTAQSVVFVISPKGDDNYQPFNACGGAPSAQTGGAGSGTESGTFGATKLSVSATRCTLAIFTPSSNDIGVNLKYSSKPCPVDAFPKPSSVGIQFTDSKDPKSLKACTAPAFLSSVDLSLTAAQDAANKVAIHDWPGASCKPNTCRVYMELVQKDGELNAPGLCSAAYYLTGPCTIAVVTTSSVAANPAGATVDFADAKCPTESNLSLPPIGDIGLSCTNFPFKPADMAMTLPKGMTPNPELQTPAAAQPQHSTEIADQAMTLDLAPAKQFTFDPPNACSFDGIKPVNRCTAAILNLPVGFAGGDVQIPQHRCTLDLSNNSHQGNNQGQPCFAEPFSPSKGTDIVKGLPAITCHAPEPAVAVAGALPAVPCRIYVVLTRDDGDFNANNPCGVLSNATTSVTTACLLASFETANHSEGDHIVLTSSTPLCPSGGATAPHGFDADVTASCIAGGNAPSDGTAFTAAAGSLAADMVTTGPITGIIPQDPVLGND